MQMKIFIFSVLLAFSSSTALAAKKQQLHESEVKFSYSSADGEFTLKCTHYLHEPALHDFDVWCGKGTSHLRTFRVHFLARQHEKPQLGKNSLEVLYWVIDRDQDMTRKFSSGSTWINFKNKSDIERMNFSQGVENDYAYLSVEYTPQ